MTATGFKGELNCLLLSDIEGRHDLVQKVVDADLSAYDCVIYKGPLLNFEWVPKQGIWRLGGVKGGCSPAQRTLDVDRAPVRCSRVECGMLTHST